MVLQRHHLHWLLRSGGPRGALVHCGLHVCPARRHCGRAGAVRQQVEVLPSAGPAANPMAAGAAHPVPVDTAIKPLAATSPRLFPLAVITSSALVAPLSHRHFCVSEHGGPSRGWSRPRCLTGAGQRYRPGHIQHSVHKLHQHSSRHGRQRQKRIARRLCWQDARSRA